MNITMQISQETLTQWGVGSGLIIIAYLIGYWRGQLKDWTKWREWAAHTKLWSNVGATVAMCLVAAALILPLALLISGSDRERKDQFKRDQAERQEKYAHEIRMKQMELDAKQQPQPQQPQHQPQVN
jgi:hypothetical protein